jgi:hypothetical protein
MRKSKNIDPRARIKEGAEHLFYAEGIRADLVRAAPADNVERFLKLQWAWP